MRLLGVAPLVPGVDQMAVLHKHFNNNSHCTIKLSYLEILLVESEVVEPVGEGVDVGDEFRARRVHVGVEEDRRVEGVLLGSCACDVHTEGITNSYEQTVQIGCVKCG